MALHNHGMEPAAVIRSGAVLVDHETAGRWHRTVRQARSYRPSALIATDYVIRLRVDFALVSVALAFAGLPVALVGVFIPFVGLPVAFVGLPFAFAVTGVPVVLAVVQLPLSFIQRCSTYAGKSVALLRVDLALIVGTPHVENRLAGHRPLLKSPDGRTATVAESPLRGRPNAVLPSVRGDVLPKPFTGEELAVGV